MARQVRSRQILGMRVDATSYDHATNWIVENALSRISTYVCVANVHMTMEAFDSPAFREVVNGAGLVTPDGMPLVWGLRALGLKSAKRVRGPDLVLHIARAAAAAKVPIALYGGTESTLHEFSQLLMRQFPALRISCAIAPPFRPPTPEEDRHDTERLRASGAGIVLVGIGCPKQERWMASHLDRIPAVMVGVGAAFDFHSGRIREAPGWMQQMGMEWLFRLAMEPRRLWRRYAKHNPRFVAFFLAQLLGLRNDTPDR